MVKCASHTAADTSRKAPWHSLCAYGATRPGREASKDMLLLEDIPEPRNSSLMPAAPSQRWTEVGVSMFLGVGRHSLRMVLSLDRFMLF